MSNCTNHFVFTVVVAGAGTRYSVIGVCKDRAGDEVKRVFALDPTFKIKNCKTYSTYMGK